MDKIIIDELTIDEINKGDIVTIEQNQQIDDTLYIILNEKEYCKLEHLGFYLYEDMDKPILKELKNNMIFYKIATATPEFLEEYETKLRGEING